MASYESSMVKRIREEEEKSGHITMYNNIRLTKEVEELKIKEEKKKDGHKGWKVFWALATFMLLPLL